jgi:hypothetical protein
MLYDEDDERPRKSNPAMVTIAAAITAVSVIGVNGWLLYGAASDRSWGALYVLFVAGPVVNGVIVLVTLLSSYLLQWLSGGVSVAIFICAGVLLPVVAIVVDAVLIFGMNLHGC